MACEQFLGKNVQDVKNVILQTLEGHLRSILGAKGFTCLEDTLGSFVPALRAGPSCVAAIAAAATRDSSAACRGGILDCSSPTAAPAVLLGVVISEFSVPAARDVRVPGGTGVCGACEIDVGLRCWAWAEDCTLVPKPEEVRSAEDVAELRPAPLRCLFQIKCFAFLPSAGTLTVEQIYQDRDQFAKLVREVAAPDVGRMGIEILSFTIKVRPGRVAVQH